MTISTELERIARLRRVFEGLPQDGIALGIGDDAAVLLSSSANSAPLVWTIDAQVEGTHFKRPWLCWGDVGWRSFMAAGSDLAAMGASPVAALSSLILPGDVDDDAFHALVDGQAEAARVIMAPIVGGNLAKGREVSVTTTLFGRTDTPMTRHGARVGDGVYLAGSLGLARAGWLLLEKGRGEEPVFASCIEAWRRPTARIADGLVLRPRAHAAIDISDGLSRDAGHLAHASSVRIVLEEEALRGQVPEVLHRAASELGVEALDLALSGGEDYALLAASPVSLDGFIRIGRVEKGPAGVMLDRGPRGCEALADRGFDHFR